MGRFVLVLIAQLMNGLGLGMLASPVDDIIKPGPTELYFTLSCQDDPQPYS